VQRTGVRGIRQTGRSAQGVTVMNVREDDRVSAVALVVESDASTSAAVAGDEPAADGPIEISADSSADGAGLDGDSSDGASPDTSSPDQD
jgi:DNA gyrase subunit A